VAVRHLADLEAGVVAAEFAEALAVELAALAVAGLADEAGLRARAKSVLPAEPPGAMVAGSGSRLMIDWMVSASTSTIPPFSPLTSERKLSSIWAMESTMGLPTPMMVGWFSIVVC